LDGEEVLASLTFSTIPHRRIRPTFLGRLLSTPLSVVGCVLLFLLMLFENPLEATLPGLNYFDEAIFLLSCLGAIASLAHQQDNLKSRESKVVILSLVILLLGLIGNLLNSYQRNPLAIASEAVAFLKFPLTAAAMLVLMRNVRTDEVINGCAAISKVFVTVCLVFCLLNLISPSELMSHDVRNGIASFKFIYTHPTFLVFALVMAYVAMDAQNRSVSFLKVACLFVLAMTMRDKAFGFIAFVIVSWVMGISKKKSIIPYLVLAAAVVLYVAWPKITAYMGYSSSPREALYTAAFQLAAESFPFGGGLASIASSLSGEYYSRAYGALGISWMDGLSPLNYVDAGDAGFAYYLGQFGFIGTALFVATLVILYKRLVSGLPLGSSRRSAVISMYGYLLITLSVEAVLTNATGVMAAVLLAYAGGGKTFAESPHEEAGPIRLGMSGRLVS
jgi:hypothetical protein